MFLFASLDRVTETSLTLGTGPLFIRSCPDVWLIHSVSLASAVQQSDSVTFIPSHTHACTYICYICVLLCIDYIYSFSYIVL